MIDTATSTTTEKPTTERSLEQRWKEVEDMQLEIKASLEEIREQLSGKNRRQLSGLIRWYANEHSFEQAAVRPDVLLVANHCVSRPNQVLLGAQRAVSELLTRSGVRKGLFQVWGPCLIQVVALYVVVTLLCVFLVPVFQNLWEEFQFEFGLDDKLPELTQHFEDVATGLRFLALPTCGLLSLLLVFAFVVQLKSRNNLAFNEHWLERIFKSKRMRAADYSWHARQLFFARVPLARIVQFVNQGQGIGRKNRSRPHEVEESEPSTPLDVGIQVSSLGSSGRLVGYALEIENHEARLDLLREIALDNWSVCQSVDLWWAGWVNSILFWFAVTLFGFLILGLLGPFLTFFSVISGLR